MKLSVLADNNTYIDRYFLGEPAACYHIEDGGARVLLDTGYSDVFMRNAAKMGLNLAALTHIAVSHGHNDHTGGLEHLSKSGGMKNITLVAHPGVFTRRYGHEAMTDEDSIGCPVQKEALEARFRLLLTAEPYAITDRLTFLGEIPAYNDFERTVHVGFCKGEAGPQKDFVPDDSALAYRSGRGLFIITGCSHSGICNILEHAKRVCGDERIAGVLGGFHLLGMSEQLARTIEYFKQNKIDNLYPCHCVSFDAKAEMHKHIPIHEAGVGMELVIE